uniref:Uncharacterized protein n=1 Tax=Tanacetum cinerariifolium TaxID=118510 RepID=A0A6L2MXJ9_TANCI|nr:hypothetical protein [Tanacetum cinerariifolium]
MNKLTFEPFHFQTIHLEELIKKDAKPARLLAITKPEMVKVVRKEAKKIRNDPERITSAKRYERIKKLPNELEIQSALPTPSLEQASSKSLGRKKKHMELEPEVKVPGLDCDRSFHKGVPFMNNMVIKESEYGIFFTDVFGDQSF